MKGFATRQVVFYLSVVLLVLGVQLHLSFLPSLQNLQGEAVALTFAILFASLVFGPRWGLLLTLLSLFTVGSVYFWNLFFQPEDRALLFSEMDLLRFGAGLVLLALLGGSIHDYVSRLESERQKWKQRVQTLVSVDAETGFDNRDRMLLELEAEVGRAKRYGSYFTFVLFQVDYLAEFQKLYGTREYKRFIERFLDELQHITRTTDKKFRVEFDQFALLLPYTPEENIGIIYERLTHMLQDYTTETGKTLSFTLHVAHTGITGKEDGVRAEDVLSSLRNELKTNAL